MKALYTLSDCQDIINRFLDKYNGEAITVEEGILGLGTVILQAEGKKSVVIKEVYVNPWNSAHKITRYNKLPKKYEQLILKLWDAQ